MVYDSMANTVVDEFNGRPITHQEYSDLFSRVCSENWKDPIDKTLALSQEDSMLVSNAVEFFTGGPAKVVQISPRDSGRMGLYRVTAAGYYACVGA